MEHSAKSVHPCVSCAGGAHVSVSGNCIAQEDGICADYGAVGDGTIAQDFCAGEKDYLAADLGLFAFFSVALASRSDCYLLVDGRILADCDTGSDDNAVGMGHG